jgi:hypothetical protein
MPSTVVSPMRLLIERDADPNVRTDLVTPLVMAAVDTLPV